MTVSTLKFTSEQFHLMAIAGVFVSESNVELIKGEIITMSPIGKKHGSCVARLNQLLVQLFIGRFIIWGQSSIKLDNGSEPQPDLAVLNWRSDFYAQQLPTPEDILLIIEVADSTIDYDRNIKMPLYAEFGIKEAWLLDVNEKILTKYSEPSSKGYKTSYRFDLNDSIICLDVAIAIADILK
jgi:Uma2 family endonuclease